MSQVVEPSAVVARVPYQQAARALLHDSLLDAAEELLREQAWSEISMAAIAKQAGVSRQTLYNEFHSRDEFAQVYVLREADRFLKIIELAIADHPDDAREALRSAFAAFLREAAENPMVRSIVVREPGADDLFALFTTQGAPVVLMATQRLSAKIVETWPHAGERNANLVAESLVRLAISHAGLPTAPAGEAAVSVGELFGPFLDEALASR